MNAVRPVKDREKSMKLLEALGRRNPKYAVMYAIGLDTGYRISDILRLRLKDIKPRLGTITLKEKKTGKRRTTNLSKETIREIQAFARILRLKPSDFLVHSTPQKKNKALSRVQAYRIMRTEASKMGLKSIGTHTMRKTYAENMILIYGDVEALKNDFKHADVKTTLMYLSGDN